MGKYVAIAVTLIVLIALPLLSSLYATQIVPPTSLLSTSRPMHNGHPMIPVPPPPPGPKANVAAVNKKSLCPLPAAQCLESYNWGGYAAAGATGSVTDVKGSWTVPALSGDNKAAGGNGSRCADPDVTWYDASVWIGIDGLTSGTVEQTGTSSDCYYGATAYYAWYEFYPAPSVAVFNVTAGDRITTEVTYNGFNSTCCFGTTVKDLTSRAVASVTGINVPTAEENSAEWITESAAAELAPSVLILLALSNFGTLTFNAATASIGGTTGSISTFMPNVYWLGMINLNFPATPFLKDRPFALVVGKSFEVDFVSAGP